MINRAKSMVAAAACGCLALGAPAQETNATAIVATTNAPIKIKPAKNPAGAFLSSTSTNGGGMIITSDQLEFDYRDLVVAFDGHVHVTDPQFTMTSDRTLVFLEGTNEIKRIIAVGNVDIVQPPDRHATCDKAVYERASGQVVMTGSPMLNRGADRVAGEEITVWLADQRIVVKKGKMQIGPETMKNRNIKP